MLPPNSPLFPKDINDITSQLPDKPLAQTASVQLYIILAEPNLFVQGFELHEYAERPPTILRGSLYIRILKPVKIKTISLSFKGQQRTEWPEGIPPKKTSHAEIEDLISHTWPFYNSSVQSINGGADIHKSLPEIEEISHFSLDNTAHFLSRSLSPATHALRRAASPSISSTSNSLTVQNSMSDLNSVMSNDSDHKPGLFAPGDYIYNFEHPIPASTPESCNVTFGSVIYNLEANITRMGTFKSNINTKLPINIVRTPSDTSIEESEPIAISRDWEDQLHYDIVIASKSITLDTYLPIAFKLVPLAKVQLHRIRIYLTENLEYYCRNKKVHRMEPVKKFLLLEQKAESGKSILNDEVFEDEISCKELEFQLFVPEKLNERQKIHPDTSFTNIQCHHWIKLCLRLSRVDVENPEKRKHYEISIDSPIHVLSPLSVHANTLLPAYENSNLLPPPSNATHNYLHAPPLSPGVIPVDNSLDAMVDHFTHLDNTQDANDIDMHLDANIYKPKDIPRELKSPQALPFSPMNSPYLRPLSPLSNQRPMHLIRRPSMNPPSFDADQSPPPFSDDPPMYESYESYNSPNLSPQREEEDVGGRFAFRGLSPDLPSSAVRHSSPSPLRFRLSHEADAPSIDDELDRDFRSRNVSPVSQRNRSSQEENSEDSLMRPSLRGIDTDSSVPSSMSIPNVPNIIPPTPMAENFTDDPTRSVFFTQSSTSIPSTDVGNYNDVAGEEEVVHVDSADTITNDTPVVQEETQPANEELNRIDDTEVQSFQPPIIPSGFRSRNSSESSLRSENSLISDVSYEPMLPLLHSVSTQSIRNGLQSNEYRDRNESIDITAMLTNPMHDEEIWHAIGTDFNHMNHTRPPIQPNFRRVSFTQQSRNKEYPIPPPNIGSIKRQNSFGVVNTTIERNHLPILSVIDSEPSVSSPGNENSSTSSGSLVNYDGESLASTVSDRTTSTFKRDNQVQLESNGYVVD